MKIIHIWSFPGPYFPVFWTECGGLHSKSTYSVQIWENTDQKTPYVDTFHTVMYSGPQTTSMKLFNYSRKKSILDAGQGLGFVSADGMCHHLQKSHLQKLLTELN